MTIKLNLIDERMLVGMTMKTFDFEYWSSVDSRYIILTIEAESKTEAIKEFKSRHPHKKYRLLDPLDD
jgi:hypothetical protein